MRMKIMAIPFSHGAALISALLAIMAAAAGCGGGGTSSTSSSQQTTTVGKASAGNGFTCIVTSAGGVKCWGRNYYKQLGNGTTADSLIPIDVSGLTSGVSAIGTGTSHACALTTAGGVKCWGDNSHGMLGDGTTVDRTAPVDVSGLTSGVAAIAVGGVHTCALTTGGGVKCWGVNSDGMLGDGTTTDHFTSIDVSSLTSGVAAITAGVSHVCALTSAGGVKCWGDNFYNQLGDGSATDRSSPVDVSGLTSGVAAISAGRYHTCARTTAGGVKCWGMNAYGELGDGTIVSSATPVSVSGLSSGVAAISVGETHTCSIGSTGGVKCWGENSHGTLGNGTTTSYITTPVDVSGLSANVASVTTGTEFTCAISSVGTLKCWGYNNYGQLGDGTTTDRSIPVTISGF